MSNLQFNAIKDRPMVQAKSLADLDKQASNEYLEERKKEGSYKDASVVSGLASHFKRAWDEAYHAKMQHENDMLACLRQRKGEYESRILASIRQEGGSEVFFMLTDVKCRGAKAAISDILLSQDDIWDIRPTTIPELSPEMEESMMRQAEIMVRSGQFGMDEVTTMLEEAEIEIKNQLEDQAKLRAEKMADKIKDQLEEAEFKSELDKFTDDIVTFGTGLIKGPVFKVDSRLQWSEDFKPIVTEEIVLDVNRISPLDFYPAPHNTTIDDGPVCIIHRLLPDQLYKMLGQKGNKDDEIRSTLETYGSTGLKDWGMLNHSERDQLEGKNTAYNSTSNYITAVEYRGGAQGKLLIEWGMDESRIGDPLKTYQVEAWMIAGKVIRCVLNGDPLGKKPISKAVFAEVPGSFWGHGIPHLMRDVQGICNAAVRALVDNMGLASGPQVAVDPEALPSGESLTNIYPWKIWQVKQGHNGSASLPIKFFQPDMRAGELIQIYERFSKYADEVTGIPAYQYGSDQVSGAGKTASGLSMLLNSSSKNLKQVIKSIDGAINGLIRRCHVYNMLFDPDQSIKGDVEIVVLGSNALLHKDQTQVRRMEMLNYTNNPVDLEIIGIEGRAKLLKESFKSMDLDQDIVPDGEELRRRKEEAMLQQQAESQLMQLQQAQQVQQPQTLDAAGNPAGGQPRRAA